MKKLQYIVAVGAAFSALVALAGASAQTPLPLRSIKPGATQQKPEGIQVLSGSDADNLIVVSTGKIAVNKAAVREREGREAAANQTISEGEKYFRAGNTQAAIVSYKAALDITPNDGLAYWRLAEAYAATGKTDEASQAFHKVLVEGFGPGNSSGVGGSADIWEEYALVLVKTHHAAEAIQMYNHGASMLDYEGSADNGGKPFLKVLFPEVVMGDAQPGQVSYTPERLQALADVLLTHEQRWFWSYKEVKAHAEEAVKLYPDSAAVQYYFGEALSGSYYGYLDSPTRDKPVAFAAYEEDKRAEAAAYKKATELGDEATKTAAKERAAMIR